MATAGSPRTRLVLGLAGLALFSGTTGAVAAATITSADIEDQTIQVQDLDPGLVKRLGRGAPVPGFVGRGTSVSAGETATLTARCAEGRVAVAGGFEVDPDIRVLRSMKTSRETGWTITVANGGASEAHATLVAYCVRGVSNVVP